MTVSEVTEVPNYNALFVRVKNERQCHFKKKISEFFLVITFQSKIYYDVANKNDDDDVKKKYQTMKCKGKIINDLK